MTRTHSAIFLVLVFLLYSCGSSKKAVISVTSNKAKPAKIKETYAAKLGVDKAEIDNVALYEFINDWYGVPYQYGGKSKKGVDCSGFATLLFENVYRKNIGGTAESIYEQCKTISEAKLREGDLVFFKIDSKKITHIGVYLQNNKFVHASTKKGIMISDMGEEYFKKYYYKSGRL